MTLTKCIYNRFSKCDDPVSFQICEFMYHETSNVFFFILFFVFCGDHNIRSSLFGGHCRMIFITANLHYLKYEINKSEIWSLNTKEIFNRFAEVKRQRKTVLCINKLGTGKLKVKHIVSSNLRILRAFNYVGNQVGFLYLLENLLLLISFHNIT